MNVVIAFIALLGLSLLSVGGVVAYRWNRARTGAAVAGLAHRAGHSGRAHLI